MFYRWVASGRLIANSCVRRHVSDFCTDLRHKSFVGGGSYVLQGEKNGWVLALKIHAALAFGCAGIFNVGAREQFLIVTRILQIKKTVQHLHIVGFAKTPGAGDEATSSWVV